MQRTTNQDHMLSEEQIRRRRKKAKQARMKRLRRLRRLLIAGMILIVAALAGLGILIYRNTYTGVINQGKKALVDGNYAKAEQLFSKAIEKDGKREEGYLNLAKTYEDQKELEKADTLFEKAVTDYPDSVGVYRAAVEFYVDSDQTDKISPIMNECTSTEVLTALDDYVAKLPVFSLDEEEVYDDVQELTLSSKGKGNIYYTIDGSEPTQGSTKYEDPIQLSQEGETTVRAIFVNQKGIPSLEVKKTFTIRFPIADAPAVSPTTGEYTQALAVEIRIPDGYTAYYTTDGSEPTEESQKYTGSLMINKDTELNVVLIDKNGRKSEVTTRKYRFSS